MTSATVNRQFEAQRALDTRGALVIVKRALRYAWDVRYRYVVKLVMAIVAIFPPLILVWPFKIIVDNVVLGEPIDAAAGGYPFFIQPLVDFLEGKSTLTIMLTLVTFGMVTIVLLGAFGESGTTTTQRDGVNSDLAEGMDVATRTENEANKAQSSIGGILGYLEFLWTIRISHLLNFRLRAEVFRKLQRLPMSTLEDERIGDAVYRVMYDTPAITELCDKTIVVPVQTIVQIYVVLLMLEFSFSEAPELFWIGFSALPIFFVVFLVYTGRLRRQWERSRNLGATTTASMEESLGNILAVQSLGGQERELNRFAAASRSSFRGYLFGYGTMLMVFATGIAVFAGIVMYALTIMTDLIIAGVLTAGDLVVIYVFYFRIFDASRKLGGLWLDLQFPIAGMRRVFTMLDLPEEQDGTSTRPFPGIRRELRFDDVSFSYPDGTEALRHIDLQAIPGEMVALVGATGSGKTTLAYMIPRFLRPTSGRVLIDGEDIGGYSLKTLRDQVTFVFQENTLFEGTIADNIRITRPGAIHEDVVRAAKTAGADEFIRSLPNGYDTWIGTKGGKLSVGQKQRISIARGLVRDAQILILDEPTSALDPETEHELVRTLHEASRDKLVIVVAHRLSTIRSADQILFMEAGEIIERGTHEQLMSSAGGAYRRFVELNTRDRGA